MVWTQEYSMIVWVRVQFWKELLQIGDWHSDNLTGSYLQSQVTSTQVVETSVTNYSSFFRTAHTIWTTV